MKNRNGLLLAIVLVLFPFAVFAQQAVEIVVPTTTQALGVNTINYPPVTASSPLPVQIISYGSLIDPCSTQINKSSAIINQSSSATTKVVDAVSGKTIYTCGFVATFVGTSPTGTFVTGTHASADCDTSAANLTGAMTPSATSGVVSLTALGTIFKSITSGQLCLTTGANTSIQGVLSYVQQ